MSCTYIKKAFHQVSKLKNNITLPWKPIALHLDVIQVHIQSARNQTGIRFNTLCLDPFTTNKNKVKKVRALHNKWLYENTKQVVKGEELIVWQWQKCKTIGQIFFRFVLYDLQIEAIWILFYK